MMTKTECLDKLSLTGHDFIVNHILYCSKNPARKLNGLVNLLVAGHEVRHASNNLYIDGHPASWIVLDEWARRYR